MGILLKFPYILIHTEIQIRTVYRGILSLLGIPELKLRFGQVLQKIFKNWYPNELIYTKNRFRAVSHIKNFVLTIYTH